MVWNRISKKIQIVTIATIVALVAFGLSIRNGTDTAFTLRVGVYQNEPKIYLNEDQIPSGLFVQLLDSIAKEERWSVEYVFCEWSLCLEQLADGQLDLMPDVAFSAERAQRFDFHRFAVVQAWSQLYVRPTTQLTDFGQLADLRLAVLEGSIQEQDLQQRMPEAIRPGQMVRVGSIGEGFAAVARGDADVAVANNFFGNRQRGVHGLVETPLTFNQVGLFYAAPLGQHPTVLEHIDHYLALWQADPQSYYYTVLAESLAVPVERMVPRWLSWLVLLFAVLVIWFIVHVVLLRWAVQRKSGELVRANARFTHLMASSRVVVYTQRSSDRSFTWVSQNVQSVLGFAAQDVLTVDWWGKHLHPDDRPLVMAQRETLKERGRICLEYRLLDPQGRIHHLRDEQQLTQTKDGHEEVVGTWTDMTEQFEQSERLHFLAHYDALTGLPNRSLLLERLTHGIANASVHGETVTVVFIDLDRFKNINDSLGNAMGDQVLKVIAERLSYANMPDVLARVNADEFVLIVERSLSDEQLSALVDHIIDQLQMPVVLNGQSLVFTASIGTCRFPQDGDSAEKLLTRAELAMFAAKQRGGNSWQTFESRLSASTEQRFTLENALRSAVTSNELFLMYQPQFDLRTQALIGVEALVRWQHPEHGVIAPNLFISLAEDIGLIDEIDAWVMHEACAQLNRWDTQGFFVPKVAVNISALELEHQSLLARTQQALMLNSIHANRLEVELTETHLMRAPERSISTLNLLKDLGVRVAIDDFGTGYSSLTYLRNLPLDYLKIDQSFVRDIGMSTSNDSILRAIVALAKALELNVLAEGIETQRQNDFLCALGCEQGQGYLLARPMTAQQVFERYRHRAIA